MVEPTESESLKEIDRFIDAMSSIHGEACKVRDGDWPADNNPLVYAPHTAYTLLDDDWQRPYSRHLGAYPAGELSQDEKYWPPVSRIDTCTVIRIWCVPARRYQVTLKTLPSLQHKVTFYETSCARSIIIKLRAHGDIVKTLLIEQAFSHIQHT